MTSKFSSMFRKFALPALAVVVLLFSIAESLRMQRSEPETPPPVMPQISPFGNVVAGAGMIEPATNASGTGNISVGSQVSGAVSSVRVSVGQLVKTGEVLFELDQRQARADLKVREAALSAAHAQLRRLKLQPRPEEVPPSEAQVQVAEANLKEMEDQYERSKKLVKEQAVTEEDFVNRFQSYQSAMALVAVARSNLALLKAGAWEPDIVIATANLEQAEAYVAQARTMLDLLLIRAPVDGTILQVNVRPGEFVSTLGGQSLIVMGNLNPLHVRVNVDEEDIPRLQLDAAAKAKLRGDLKQEEVPLTFVRLEPAVVPKTSLTGDNIERVDTRVVQLIYQIDPDHRLVKEKKMLVGQIVDVFIEVAPSQSPAGHQP